MTVLSRLRAVPLSQEMWGASYVFERYEPVPGPAPTRTRRDNNPLNRKEYLMHVLRRV